MYCTMDTIYIQLKWFKVRFGSELTPPFQVITGCQKVHVDVRCGRTVSARLNIFICALIVNFLTVYLYILILILLQKKLKRKLKIIRTQYKKRQVLVAM